MESPKASLEHKNTMGAYTKQNSRKNSLALYEDAEKINDLQK